MIQRTPPLTWLRAFEATARHLSFTRASEELGLTQSAVSQHVRALEAHLRQQLFHRAHHQLHLTDAGRLLLPDVTAGLALLGKATGRFQTQPNATTLRVATSASVARHILAPGIAEFRDLHPTVVIEIISTVWPDDFLGTANDVEIRFGRAEQVGQDATMLAPSGLHVVATPALAHAFKVGNPPPRIGAVGLSTGWSDLENGAQADIRVDTHGLAIDLALAGAGMALTHTLISRPAVKAGDLVVLPFAEVPATEGYFVAVSGKDDTTVAQAFADWLKQRSGWHE